MSNFDEKFRCFLALPLPESISLELYQNTKKIFLDFPKFRLVSVRNYHVTLQFFGDITLSAIEDIQKNISKIKFDDINVKLSNTGFFPNVQSPKVFWIGFKDKKKRVDNLYETIQGRLKEVDFNKEKRLFIPHLTIARLQKINLRTIKKLQKSVLKFNQIISNFPTFNLEKLVLYKSVLTSKGSVYTPLHVVHF